MDLTNTSKALRGFRGADVPLACEERVVDAPAAAALDGLDVERPPLAEPAKEA